MKTMALWLECPVCEYRFSVPGEFAEKSGKCPKCESVFNAADCQLPEKEVSADAGDLEIPEPIAISNLEIDSSQPAAASVATATAEVKVNEPVNYDMPYVPANKKKTDPNRVLYLVIGCCVGAVALLIGIPLVASMMLSSDPSDKQDVASSDPKKSTNNQEEKLGSNPKPKSNQSKNGKKQSAKKQNSKPGATIVKFTPNELKEIWTNVSTGVVLVNAKRNSKTVSSHGVVISNDGLIAVNWNQVKDAETIQVRFAATSYGAKERWEKPVAVQNIVSKNEALNVAIIQIDQLTIPVKPRIAAIEDFGRAVVPILNNKTSAEFLRQTRLRSMKPISEVTDSQKKILAQNGFTPPAQTMLFVHTARVHKVGVGVPVFDGDGLFCGVHGVHDEDSKLSFGIPHSALIGMINGADSKTATTSETSGNQAEKGNVAEPDDGTAADALTFRQALDAMIKIKWNVDEPGFFPAAQGYASALDRLVKENLSADFTRRNEIGELQNESTESQRQFLLWPAETQRIAVNTKAIESLDVKRKVGWIGFLKISKPKGMAPVVSDQPSMVARLVGTNDEVLLLAGEIEGPFVQGTQWIVFGVTDNRKIRIGDKKLSVIRIAGVKKK